MDDVKKTGAARNNNMELAGLLQKQRKKIEGHEEKFLKNETDKKKNNQKED